VSNYMLIIIVILLQAPTIVEEVAVIPDESVKSASVTKVRKNYCWPFFLLVLVLDMV